MRLLHKLYIISSLLLGVQANAIKHITSGHHATLTYFTDSETQCYGSDIPHGNGLAINPLLLGISESEWVENYQNADPKNIWYCGLFITLHVKNRTFRGRIIDTCDPVGNPFVDSDGIILGGKCDYTNAIDLYQSIPTGSFGLEFLNNITNGDDFYQGKVYWKIDRKKSTYTIKQPKCKGEGNN